MTKITKWRIGFGLVLSALMLRAAVAEEVDRDARLKELQAMQWVHSGNTLHLQKSQSGVSLPPDYIGIDGKDVGRFEELTQGERDDDTEAVVLGNNDETVLFQFISSGYVTMDDWSKLNSSDLISEIKENTEASNEARRTHGLRPLHVTGWLQEPSLDRATNTVYWAISAKHDDGSGLVNSVALRLSRSGYEKVIWVVGPQDFKSTGGALDTMLRAHSFNNGQRYEDHQNGDRLAGFGIAALVGAVAGAKLAKVAAAGGLLLALKKFWFLAFAGLLVFYRKIKARFTSNPTV